MDKVLAIIIGATAVLLTGVMVLAVLNTNIGGLVSDLNDTRETGCDFQRENADSEEELSERCKEDSTSSTSLEKNEYLLDSALSTNSV